MRKIFAILIFISLLAVSAPALAAKGGEKGASAQAQENASPQAIFNRVSDWFATVGKSTEEKEAILAERRANRAAEHAEKEAIKAAKHAEDAKQEAKRAAEARRKALKGAEEAAK